MYYIIVNNYVITHVISLKRFDVSKLFFLMVLKIRFATVEGVWVSNDLSAGMIYTLFCVYPSITSYLSSYKPLKCTSVESQEGKCEKIVAKFFITSFGFREI